MAANIKLQVYKEILNKIMDEIMSFNYILEPGYHSLLKSMFLKHFNENPDFHMGDSQNKSIAIYVDKIPNSHDKWLDIIVKSMELNISISLEEQLLTAISCKNPILFSNNIFNSNIQFQSNRSKNDDIKAVVHDQDVPRQDKSDMLLRTMFNPPVEWISPFHIQNDDNIDFILSKSVGKETYALLLQSKSISKEIVKEDKMPGLVCSFPIFQSPNPTFINEEMLDKSQEFKINLIKKNVKDIESQEANFHKTYNKTNCSLLTINAPCFFEHITPILEIQLKHPNAFSNDSFIDRFNSQTNWCISHANIKHISPHYETQDIQSPGDGMKESCFLCFISEQEDIFQSSLFFKSLFQNKFGVSFSSNFQLHLSFSFFQNCFQLFQSNLDSNPSTVCNLTDISLCTATVCSNAICKRDLSSNFNIQKFKDIGHVSFFRSFSLETQHEILKRIQDLPCSKELRLDSLLVQKYKTRPTVSATQEILKTTDFSNALKNLINSENQLLQNKHFSLLSTNKHKTYHKMKDIATDKENQYLYEISNKFLLYLIDLWITDEIDRFCNEKINRQTSGARSAIFVPKIQNPAASYKQIPIDTILEIRKHLSVPMIYGDLTGLNKNLDEVTTSDNKPLVEPIEFNQQLRCLNLIVYFFEELFEAWIKQLISVEDVKIILPQLLKYLKSILQAISVMKSIAGLAEITNSCIGDIETLARCSFDQLTILKLLRSIIHKVNIFGKLIFTHRIIPNSLKYSLFKLHLYYKTGQKCQRKKKLCSCSMKITAKPDTINSLFFNIKSDRRLKWIEKKCQCCIKLQRTKMPNEEFRLVKIYYWTQEKRDHNFLPLISMISKALDQPYNKIQISTLKKIQNDSINIDSGQLLDSLGKITWAQFKSI